MTDALGLKLAEATTNKPKPAQRRIQSNGVR